MDVRKSLLMFAWLLLTLTGCGASETESNQDLFNKPEGDGCESLRIANEYLVRWKDGHVSVENADSDENFIDKFIDENKEEIVTTEPHFRINGFSLNQLKSIGFGGDTNWGVEKIRGPEVWDMGYKGQGVIVAVIDSGFDAKHDELQGVMAKNEAEVINGLDDDGNGLVDDRWGYDFVGDSATMIDRTGHGSHVAGIIVANHDYGSVHGAAPEAKLLPLNFIGADGTGSIHSAIRSIQYASSRGAKVINASWGGEYCSLALRDELKKLEKQNVLFVSAAGNSTYDLEVRPEYPAAFNLQNHISVAASTYFDKTAGFSNYGSPVAVAAPGANINSTIPKAFDFPTCIDKSDYACKCEGDSDPKCELDGLIELDGTSMAAPYVSAAAAVLWSAKPEAHYSEIKSALLESVMNGPYPVSTRGRIDMKQAIDTLLGKSNP